MPNKFVMVIVGNLGAGKSSVATALQRRLPQAPILCLDNFRMQDLQGNRQRAENEAKIALRKVLLSADKVIYEMTHPIFTPLIYALGRRKVMFYFRSNCGVPLRNVAEESRIGRHFYLCLLLVSLPIVLTVCTTNFNVFLPTWKCPQKSILPKQLRMPFG